MLGPIPRFWWVQSIGLDGLTKPCDRALMLIEFFFCSILVIGLIRNSKLPCLIVQDQQVYTRKESEFSACEPSPPFPLSE